MPLDGFPQDYHVEVLEKDGRRTLVVESSHFRSSTPLDERDEQAATAAALDSAQLHHGAQRLLASSLLALQPHAAELAPYMDRVPGTEVALPSAEEVVNLRHEMLARLELVRMLVEASLGEAHDPARTAAALAQLMRPLATTPKGATPPETTGGPTELVAL